MSAIYLAARYGRREELCGYATALRARGHIVTAGWLADDHHRANAAAMERGPSLEERREWAGEDWADLSCAGILIAFTEAPGAVPGRARGGRWVEMGLALAWGKRTIICGPVENVFCALDCVERYESWSQLLGVIDAEMATVAGRAP